MEGRPLDDLKNCIERIERLLMTHDGKTDMLGGRMDSNSQRTAEASERIEKAIDKMSDILRPVLVRLSNGQPTRGSIYLDLAFKIILMLVGIVALLTLGPQGAAHLLGR